jgi:formiminoglutamase
MRHFKYFSKEDILSLTRIRKYETKLGERVQPLRQDIPFSQALSESNAEYVIIGIPEDIGVKANLGKGGADTAWLPFLTSFLNIQSNDLLSGDDILMLGHFDFGDIKYLIEHNASGQDEKLEAYRHAVNTIDAEVEHIINIIAAAGKMPVIIGGGHNNAYPIIKGVAKGLHKSDKLPLAQINCVNMDAQSDYRPLEGRHSGNAFRYAEDDGYLCKYFILGLHENYLSQSIMTDIGQNPFVQYVTYEDLFIRGKLNFMQAVSEAFTFIEDSVTGIEIDLDSIQDVLSSAYTPSGFTALDARRMVNFMGQHAQVGYLHIAEGACRLSDGVRDDSTGKLISYLVSDFIKAHANDNHNASKSQAGKSASVHG